MKNVAVIDIGSNTIRLVVYKIHPNNSFKILDDEKQMARLGEYIDKDSNLSDEGILKTLSTLKLFKAICDNNSVDKIFAIATETIRNANNKDELLTLIKKETGFNVHVLTGYEESFYGYMAVKYSLEFNDALIADLGGASMELALVKNKEICNIVSIPIGSIPLTKKFPFDTPATTDEMNRLKILVTKYFTDFPWLNEVKNLPLIGIGGTSRIIGNIHKIKTDYPLNTIHNYSVSFDDVTKIYDGLCNMGIEEKYKVRGLPKDRADIFTAPLGAMVTLMEYCSCTELRISEYGIREGVLYSTLLGDSNKDVLDLSLDTIITNQNLNKSHSERVLALSTLVYNTLISTDSNYRLLKASCMLHDIGTYIAFSKHYNHSFYMILNSHLSGLTHKELLMVSYIVALSGKSDFRLSPRYKSLLSSEDINTCHKLSTILSLSHKLEKYFSGNVQNISVSSNNLLQIKLPLDNSITIDESIGNNIKINLMDHFNKKLQII